MHHNFVRRELHAGELLLVHRKGALGLERGERGVIPGSMATATSLVEGKGEPLSFRSCSHGAGRTLSRKEARRKIAPSMLRRAMKRVAYDTSREGALVEEAPQAYRDLGEVLEDEEELVTPLVRLEPLLVLKG